MTTFYEMAITALRGAKYVYDKTRYTRNLFKYTDQSYDPNAMERFSGKSRAKAIEEYSESLGLGENLPAAKGFDNYAKSHMSGINQFTTTKVGEDSLAKKLTVTRETTDEVKAAIEYTKDQVSKALKLTDETRIARNTFKDDMANLKECVADPTFEYKPMALINYVYSIRNKALDGIEKQQASEIKNLEGLFADNTPAANPFTTNLKKSLHLDGVDPAELEEQVDAVKNGMLAELHASHLKERTAFEESINGPLTKILATSRARIDFLEMADRASAENYANITKLGASPDGGLTAEGTSSASRIKGSRYKNIDPKKLETFVTATGRRMNTTGESSYSMSFPNRLLSRDYYSDTRHNLKADIMSLPMRLKAEGCDIITMNIKHPDKEYAKELARLAAETCAECGFKDITINVNGETYSDKKEPGTIRAKLFDECPQRWDNSVGRAKQNEVDWKKANNTVQNETPENLGARVNEEIRKKRAAEAEARAAEPARTTDNDDHDDNQQQITTAP